MMPDAPHPHSSPAGHGWLALLSSFLLAGLIATLSFCSCGSSADAPDSGNLLEYVLRRAAQHVLPPRGEFCRRPVLRGAPLPGDASRLLREVIAAGGETEPCGSAVRAALSVSPSDPLVHGFASLQACEPALARLRSAIQHEAACSPYALAPADEGEEFVLPYSRIGTALASRALEIGEPGDHAEALRLLLDGMRFSQDVDRGAASSLVRVASYVFFDTILLAFQDVLGRPGSIGADVLSQVDRELVVLQHSEAPLDDAIERMALGSVADHSLRSLLPGDETYDHWLRERFENSGIHDVVRPETEANLRWVGDGAVDALLWEWQMADEAATQVRFSCPPSTAPEECAGELRSVGTEPSTGMERGLLESIEGFSMLVRALGVDAERVARRMTVLAILRLAVALRREIDSTGACPTSIELAGSSYARLRRDPWDGGSLQVVRAASGALRISGSTELAREHDRRLVPELLLRCPPPGIGEERDR